MSAEVHESLHKDVTIKDFGVHGLHLLTLHDTNYFLKFELTNGILIFFNSNLKFEGFICG